MGQRMLKLLFLFLDADRRHGWEYEQVNKNWVDDTILSRSPKAEKSHGECLPIAVESSFVVSSSQELLEHCTLRNMHAKKNGSWLS